MGEDNGRISATRRPRASSYFTSPAARRTAGRRNTRRFVPGSCYSHRSMTFAWLALGVLLVAAGLAGLILPALPGMPLVFIGAVAIAAADGFTRVGYVSLAVLAVLAVAGMVLDHLAGVLGARQFGASRWGIIGSIAGLVVGLPFGLPGIVFGPALGALALEFARDRELRRAARAGTGVLVGFVLGTIGKYAIASMMIGLLALAYLF